MAANITQIGVSPDPLVLGAAGEVNIKATVSPKVKAYWAAALFEDGGYHTFASSTLSDYEGQVQETLELKFLFDSKRVEGVSPINKLGDNRLKVWLIDKDGNTVATAERSVTVVSGGGIGNGGGAITDTTSQLMPMMMFMVVMVMMVTMLK